MKKNQLLAWFFSKPGWKKLLLTMKITLMLLIIGIQVNASIYSQNKKFSMNIKNKTLREVFSEIVKNK